MFVRFTIIGFGVIWNCMYVQSYSGWKEGEFVTGVEHCGSQDFACRAFMSCVLLWIHSRYAEDTFETRKLLFPCA